MLSCSPRSTPPSWRLKWVKRRPRSTRPGARQKGGGGGGRRQGFGPGGEGQGRDGRGRRPPGRIFAEIPRAIAHPAQGPGREKAVETRLVDENERNAEVARPACDQAEAQLASASASIEEGEARLQAARSDIAEAQAGLRLAQTVYEQAVAAAGDSRIVSPWDGFVTRRGYHVGDYLSSAQAAGLAPLLTSIRSGKVRVAVKVPDRDAPFLDKGDRATVRIDSLPGQEYRGVVSRTSVALDTDTRTVRAEIDLDNADGHLRPGQYGTVTIDLLDRHNVRTIPTSAPSIDLLAAQPRVIASSKVELSGPGSGSERKMASAWKCSKG